jgi:tRNA(Arg) A34 adenosine deaminase TadA
MPGGCHVNDADLQHLRRCVELATEALEAGDEPFASVLVAGDGTVLAEDRNRVAAGDRTRHPEFELARWAAANMTPRNERRRPFTPRASIVRCAPLRTAGRPGPYCLRKLF